MLLQMIFLALLVLTLTLLLSWMWKMRMRRGILESLGIPIVPARFFGILGSGPFDLHNRDINMDYVNAFKELKVGGRAGNG